METAKPTKLPPMTALEFAIENVFRHFFFSLRMGLLWAILMVPLAIAAYYVAFRNGIPDPRDLPQSAYAVFGALAAAAFVASMSIAVNWHRRLLLNETPKGLGWVRLNGVVWKFLFSVLFMLAVLAIFGGIIFAIQTKLFPAIESKLEANARAVANVLSALVGLSALFTCYRIASWLPAVATGDKDYSLRSAWRSTRWHRLRYLGFTFWLLFSLAAVGVVGAGAFFGQKMLGNPYATIGAFALIAILGWMAMFLLLSIPACHYRYLASPRAPSAPPVPEPGTSS